MDVKQVCSERDLATLAKRFRKQSGKTKAALGREIGVTRATMQDAEERPGQSLTKLRIRIIERCSPYRITGPFYHLNEQSSKRVKPT
jgi:DNA-binding XRE family transcriptional regulator